YFAKRHRDPVFVAVAAHLDARHWSGPGPRISDQPKGSFHDRAVRWINKHRAGSYVAQRLAVDHVAVLLEESRERRIEKRDALEPLHRRHPVPAGHDQTKWPAVLRWDRLTLHEVCDEHVVAKRVVDRQRPLVTDPPPQVFGRTLVGSANKKLDGLAGNLDRPQDITKRGACPCRCPDRALAPLLTGYLRIEESPSLSGALERHDHRPRGQRADLVEGKRSRRGLHSVDDDRPRTDRDRKVRPNVMSPRRRDRRRLGEARFRIQRFFAQDQKVAVAHAISLPAAAD